MDVYRTVYGFGIQLSVFLFYFIQQGEELISATMNGDKAAVERLLKENPSLISYKGVVSREESSYTTTYLCSMSIYMLVLAHHPTSYYTTCIYPFTRQPDRRDSSLSLTTIHTTLYSYSPSTHVCMEGYGRMVPCMYRGIVCSCTSIKS
jgi:hypothetical protein